MDPIRIGVIGCGGIFRAQHAPYYEVSEHAKIVAVADRNPATAQTQAERFGAEVLSDYRAVLDRDDVDAVDVCTHPRPHREICVAAAQAGKHILVEKPMCCSVAEADAMIAAADAANVRLQVAYIRRYDPSCLKLKELLEDGTLGGVHLVYSNQVGWFRPQHPWLFVQEESGGMLIEQAIHTLDEWLWLYGPAVSVYAQTSQVVLGGTYPEPEESVDNNATVMFKFASGATGMLIKSWAAEVGHSGSGVVGSKGSATFGAPGLRWKLHGQEESSFDAGALERPIAPKGYSIEHWLKCIAGEEEPTTSGQVGRQGIAMAEAAYRSALTAKVMEL